MEPYEEENNPKTAAEEGSILDKKPLRICGHPLTTRQQMWLGFMLPATISTLIFLSDFALNIAVAYQLLRDGHGFLGIITMILVYAPAVTCLILTLTCPPKLKAKELAVWIVIQLLQTLAFPVGIMHRFASRLFWSIVALTEKDPNREQALQRAASSHQTELFFLMDSFLNAGPQAALQAYILLSPHIVTTDETAWTQAICFATSLITLSKTAALHQRFESQRIAGRPVLWILKQSKIHARALVHLTKFDPLFLMGLHNAAQPKDSGPASLNQEHSENQEISALKQQEDNLSQRSEPAQRQPNPEQLAECREQEVPHEYECESISDLTTGDRQNDPQEQDSLLMNSSTSESTENNVQDQEPLKIRIKPIEDRCFWPRIATPPTSPTADPHMCPRLSINTIRSQNRPAYTSHVRFHVSKPRTKGLHEDEPLGILIAFNAWLPYLTARILVLAAFSNLYVWASLGLIISHYTIMVSYLCFCGTCKSPWMPLLGFIYILLPIEVNVQYKYPRVFLVMFFALAFLENLGTGILWYYGTVQKNWWHDFTFYFIFGCEAVAALNATLYLFMFKPKVKYVE